MHPNHLPAAPIILEPSARAMRYTPAQQQAIYTIDDDLLLIACAGSGKTQVVTQRVVHILQSQQSAGILPENIVVLTFNTKAAHEIKERIGRLYEEAFGHRQGLAGMFVATIHSYGLHLLQTHVPAYLKRDVLSEVQQRLLIDRFPDASGLTMLNLQPYIDTALYQTLLRLLRETRVDKTILREHPALRALQAYQTLLAREGYLDYDEIAFQAATELKRNTAMQAQVRAQVKYLVVDEAQDVAPIQEQLLQRIQGLGANLCVCGDEDQHLYGWRGSDPNFLRHFSERYPRARRVTLNTNYRSTPAVVQAAEQIINKVTERRHKPMMSSGKRPAHAGDLLCLAFADPIAEADWIAERIHNLQGTPYVEANGTERGLAWSDCAILLRSVKRCAAPLLAALRRRGIPAVVTGLTGLFACAEVRAGVGIFQFLAGKTNKKALLRLWQEAEVGLTIEAIEQGVQLLQQRLAALPQHVLEAQQLSEPQQTDGQAVSEEPSQATAYDLQRLYLDFLTAIGLREEQVPGALGAGVYANLGQFSQVIGDYESIYYHVAPRERYAGFVQFVCYQAAAHYAPGEAETGTLAVDAVRIATIHAVKGMEFPAVFIPCLQADRFPARDQPQRVWDLIPRAAIPGAAHYDTTLDSERRLLYVALTRAEKYLVCSWAPDPTRKNQQPSIFWEELRQQAAFLPDPPALASDRPRLTPQPRRPLVEMSVSFSHLRYLLECPRQFRLRFVYGFQPAVAPALGYGRSLHNALADLHRRVLHGERFTKEDYTTLTNELLERHLHLPFADDRLRAILRQAAEANLHRYLVERGASLPTLEHIEESIEVVLPGGLVVTGRMDMVHHTQTGERAIVDYKTRHQTSAETIPWTQLLVYAPGYRQRYGVDADVIEVYHLADGTSERRRVDADLVAQTLARVTRAGERLRSNDLPRLAEWCTTCETCDHAGLCRHPDSSGKSPSKEMPQ